MFGLTEPCRQIHGRNSWVSISLAEEKEGGGGGRKKQENRAGMVLSMGAKLCCGAWMDTGDATPKHLPVSSKEGKTSLKSGFTPLAPAQTLASDVMFHPIAQKTKVDMEGRCIAPGSSRGL